MLGMLWMAGAALCFSVSFSLVRYLGDFMSTFEIVFLRQLFGAIFMMPWFLKVGIGGLRTTRFRLHVLRAVFSYLGMLTAYFSLILIPMADSVAIQFTLPMFTAVLAVIFLGERVGVLRWAAIGIGFAGILVIVKPGFAEISAGVVFALIAPACYAGGDVAARALTRTDATSVLMFYSFVLQLPLAAVPAAFVWTTPPLALLPAILAFAVAATAAQWCLTRSFGLAEASLVSPVLFLRLPFVAIIGYAVFGQVTRTETWIGAGVILIGTMMLVMEGRKPRHPASGA